MVRTCLFTPIDDLAWPIVARLDKKSGENLLMEGKIGELSEMIIHINKKEMLAASKEGKPCLP